MRYIVRNKGIPLATAVVASALPPTLQVLLFWAMSRLEAACLRYGGSCLEGFRTMLLEPRVATRERKIHASRSLGTNQDIASSLVNVIFMSHCLRAAYGMVLGFVSLLRSSKVRPQLDRTPNPRKKT